MGYRINQVSQKIGVKPQVIRYYEHEGILTNIQREANGYRSYSEDDMNYIQFLESVKKLKRNGLPLIELREYARLMNGEVSDFSEANEILTKEEEKISQIIQELTTLQTFIDEKKQMYV